MAPHSHSAIDPRPATPDLEWVVCDICGHDDARRLATLPPPDRLLWPMHRLGASALALDGQPIHLVECRRCGLVYMNPRLTEAAIARFYDTVYAAGAAELFESDLAVQVRYYLDALSRHVAAPRPHLLDIGCGAGQLLALAQARGWRIDGAELSAYAAQHASQTLGVPVHCGDFRTMGLAPGSLDAVTLIHVLEHVRAPVDFLRDAAALLRPGGVLMFDAPNVDSAEARLARRLRQPWRGFIIEHLYYFRPALLRRLVADLGLELIAIDGYLPGVPLPNPLRAGCCARQPTTCSTPSPRLRPGGTTHPPAPSLFGRAARLRPATPILSTAADSLPIPRRACWRRSPRPSPTSDSRYPGTAGRAPTDAPPGRYPAVRARRSPPAR